MMCTVAAICFLAAGIFSAPAQLSNGVAAAPVYVPDTTHANDPLPDGVIGWEALSKAADATNEQSSVRFDFTFTNLVTSNITVIAVRPSCGCTTAELPPMPWTVPAGSNGTIKFTVNLQGKSGTLFKTVNVSTDQGRKELLLRINIQPPPPLPEMTADQRAAGVAAAKLDRQAVFKGDCASCHLKKTEGKYGQQLYDALCSICHEAQHRNTMVPDLHNLSVPTNDEFWRTWITFGKAGSLMPAFATAQGGPLSDLQIATLAAYLNTIIPSRATPTTTAPAK
jgi:mono/diheme cytochrome c family protein